MYLHVFMMFITTTHKVVEHSQMDVLFVTFSPLGSWPAPHQRLSRSQTKVPLLPEGPKRSCDPGLRQLDSDGGETTAATMLCAKVGVVWN